MRKLNECKIMSFNLRVAGDFDGVNQFEFRKPRIKELIGSEEPDVIGFQEVVDASREWLRKELFDRYDIIGGGRNADCRGEGIPIAFRRDRFTLVSFETFWLSDTPSVPGSRFENCDQSPLPRISHIAILKPWESNCFLRVINTHLDHKGREARIKELALLSERISASNCPSVLLGDFNIASQCQEISDFSEHIKQIGWSDSGADLGGTFHDYGRRDPPIKIDYIFTNCPYSESKVINTEPVHGVYYSDHYAVTTTIVINESF